MPRSSRHKSSHQHKHSSKDVDSEEEEEVILSFKEKNGKEKTMSSGDSEKRKLVGNGDLVGGGYNGSSSKRRKEKGDDGQWNGGEVVVSKEKLVDVIEDGLKSKADLKSKSGISRRHEERKSEVVEKEDAAVVVKKSIVSNGKVEVKTSRADKDLSKKEVHYKEPSTKEKEHRSSEREKKNQDVRRETKIDSGAMSVKKDVVNAGKVTYLMSVKKDVVNAEGEKHDELRNPELERELEKRIRRRRDDSDDKDKYHDDSRDAKESRVSSRSSRCKDEKQQDDKYRESHHEDVCKDTQKDDRNRGSHHEDLRKDKQKDDRYRESHHDDLRKDKQKDDRYRESHHDDLRKDKQRDDRYRESHHEDLRKDHTNRDDKRRDDCLKDHSGQRSDTKYPRDEKRSPREKSSPKEREGHGSPRNDDRVTIYKDSREKKRYSDDIDEYSDVKSRNAKENHSVAEKKTLSSSRKESPADRGRSQSRHIDYDSTVSRSRRRSPSPNAHPVKDQFRSSSKAESQYIEPLSDERIRPNVTPSRERGSVHGGSKRASESWSAEKRRSTTKPSKEEGKYLANISAGRSPVCDRQASPAQLVDKSQSSTSYERRYSNRANVKRSLDMEENGRRDDRGSREWPLEKPAADEFRQADGDTVSVSSSSFNRNNHFPSNASSIPTTPSFKGGASNPSVFGSSEEDSRGKSNRYRRTGDFNVGRGSGNAWKGVPNWPSPLPNNFMPFQHGPPPGGFHSMMQQFPAPPLYGNHPGIPYHMPDADRFAVQMHGWDGSSNRVFGDESHMYGRPDWDHNRHMLNGRGWDGNSDMWKGQNNPAAPEKDDHGLSSTADDVWAGHPSQRSRNERNRPNFRAKSIEVKRSEETPPPPKVPIEAPPVKQIPEKTPEPVKTPRHSDSHFYHVYLSKLDISVDLTHPQLYKQCMSLLEENPMSDYDSKHAHVKGFEESRLKVSNTTLSTSLFPILKDTVLQRAMLLYRKRGEETQTKLPLSSPPGSEPGSAPSCTHDKAEIYPSFSGKKQETLLTTVDETVQINPLSAQEIAKEPTTAEIVAEETSPAQMRIEELVSAKMMIGESVPVEMMVDEPILAEVMMVEQPISFEMAVEDPVLTQTMVEKPVPAQLLDEEPVPAQMVDEPVPAQTMVEEPTPPQMMVKEPASARMMVEEPVSAQTLVEESVPSRQMVHDSAPATDYEKFGEADLNSDKKKTEVLGLISDEGEEPVLDSDQEKERNLVPNFYQEEQEPIAYHREVDLVAEEDGGATATDAEHSKSGNGSRYDPLGYTQEVCEEGLTPESMECRSVNLSRIHSSKSTH